MLYYGKLRKHREFLYSEDLTDADRGFFDHWYNRCRNGNSLMPFLDKKLNNKVWLFIIIANRQLYIGLTAISQDLSERQFPFTCFDVLPISDEGVNNNMLIANQKIREYIQKILQFNGLVQDGKLSRTVLETLNIIDTGTEVLSPVALSAFLKNVANTFGLGISNQSCWLEVKSGYFINHQNSLTCSLYNKIYG